MRHNRKHPIVIPIALGVTGAVSKMTEDAIKTLNGMGIPLQLSKLQRAAAIGTAKIMQKHINSGSKERAYQAESHKPAAGDDHPDLDLVEQM